mmetsp:Transcript_15313/g.33304  ORF Transcript_15313/g.33304 Transcript_15313/m.33304 type:complete len:89 (-) Transcript_15313:780-1046(-)
MAGSGRWGGGSWSRNMCKRRSFPRSVPVMATMLLLTQNRCPAGGADKSFLSLISRNMHIATCLSFGVDVLLILSGVIIEDHPSYPGHG